MSYKPLQNTNSQYGDVCIQQSTTCQQCGSPVQFNATFCTGCGASQSQYIQPAQPQYQPAQPHQNISSSESPVMFINDSTPGTIPSNYITTPVAAVHTTKDAAQVAPVKSPITSTAKGVVSSVGSAALNVVQDFMIGQPPAQETPKIYRSRAQSGRTRLRCQDKLDIIYNAELESSCCEPCHGFPFCLFYWHFVPQLDQERSYIYIRENSIEYNKAIKYACGPGGTTDNINVIYFDRTPFNKSCCLPVASASHVGVYAVSTPKIEVMKIGHMCCCIPCKPICSNPETVVITYGKNRPMPWCCCTNEAEACDNCCGCFGPLSGNPVFYNAMHLVWGMPGIKYPKVFAEKFKEVKIGSYL